MDSPSRARLIQIDHDRRLPNTNREGQRNESGLKQRYSVQHAPLKADGVGLLLAASQCLSHC